MGHRLSRIYTRTGDDGTTGLADGRRIAKHSPRVEAYGTVDELNATIGMVIAFAVPEPVRKTLVRVQHELFNLGGELAMPDTLLVQDTDVARLEQELDAFNETLPPLKEFILPGGGQAAAACHLARTVARRAERRLAALAAEETVNPACLHYLNRLSDLLFVLCRVLTRAASGEEIMWASARLEGIEGR
ncbi:MAG TPA: cob(I)yrinic acid a,c-diamide adenosyltransferase [Gammaproteobacteria bacterium]|nr:cob(I)yrinic acid a,c-diamide adenosyltransferase [Gammaproteobacteria bacterium]